MTRLPVGISMVLVVFAPGVLAHDLPDGVVERDVQIVLFPERAEVQYTIELNAPTMQQELRRLHPEVVINRDLRKAWEQYREALAAELPKHISFEVDRVQQPLKAVSSETIEKHSIQLYFVLTTQVVAKTEAQTIVVEDMNFHDKPGFHRLALKGRRDVIVKDSTVPPVVSGLPRTSWTELTQDQQHRATRAEARFRLPQAIAR